MDSQSQCDADRKAAFVVLYTDFGSHARRASGCMEKSHKKSLMIKNSDLIDLRGRVSMREYTD